MDIFFLALLAAYGAFCVWLIVQIINRRERWAKWTLVVGVWLPVLYVASFGPACGAVKHCYVSVSSTELFYDPLLRCVDLTGSGGPVFRFLDSHARLFGTDIEFPEMLFNRRLFPGVF